MLRRTTVISNENNYSLNNNCHEWIISLLLFIGIIGTYRRNTENESLKAGKNWVNCTLFTTKKNEVEVTRQ